MRSGHFGLDPVAGHELLIDHDGELWIVDTASTHGIWIEQERTDSEMLRLTTSAQLHWSRRA
jgi:hypothetical protein